MRTESILEKQNRLLKQIRDCISKLESTGGGGTSSDVTILNQITGYALEATLSALNAKFSSLGQKPNATSHPVTISTEQEGILADIESATTGVDVKFGDVSATPVANTLLGRLKEIEDLLKRGSSSTISSVNDGITTSVFLPANTNRVKAVIVNDSNATLFVAEAATATTTFGDYSYRLLPGDTAIIGDYTGVISGIWDANSVGGASITETVI